VFYPLLSQAGPGVFNPLPNAVDSASNTAAKYDSIWQSALINGPMFTPLVKLSLGLAVITVMFFMLKLFKDLQDNNNTSSFSALIWPVIVIILLANNGAIQGKGTIGLRNTINATNLEMLKSTNTSLSLASAYREAKQYIGIQSRISDEIRRCQALPAKQISQCLDQADQKSQSILNEQNFGSPWVRGLRQRLTLTIENLKSNIGGGIAAGAAAGGNAAGLPGSVAGGVVGGAVGTLGAANTLLSDQWASTLQTYLLLAGTAWQAGFEISLLVIGLLGALATGLSLLPVPNASKPVFMWLSAFFGMFLIKIGYNVMIGLASTILVNSEAGDPTWVPIFIAFIAPFLSLTIGGGLGVLLFRGLTVASLTLAKAGFSLTRG
jgi:hypothetical protein